jgi:ssDNA-binding Zn-finger/Zn-ribbon topoisomerase 1
MGIDIHQDYPQYDRVLETEVDCPHCNGGVKILKGEFTKGYRPAFRDPGLINWPVPVIGESLFCHECGALFHHLPKVKNQRPSVQT